MKKQLIALVLAVLLTAAFAGCTVPQSAQSESANYWPEGEWRTSAPEQQGMDSAVLADMIKAIPESGKSIDSITIIRNGYLVSETYFYPYQKGYRHALNSCTKSVLSALVGIAIEEGYIKSIDDKVLDYFPGVDVANMDERKQSMTIRNLLNMTTGFEGLEDVGAATNEMTASSDWTKFTLDLPMKQQPGTSLEYSNGAANIMSAILQKATGKTASEYAEEKLAPLGLDDIYWSANPEGINTGYSGIYMTPDDAAKFGYLYLNGGVWNGQQIVPKDWAAESTKQQAAGGWTPIFPGYGYMWWMSRFGGYAALGFGGDYIFVVPEKQLVVVITSGIFDYSNLFYPGELMEQYILPAVKSDSALAPNEAAEEALNSAVKAVGEPEAQPVGELPATAYEVSGKTLTLTGEGGTQTLTIYFEQGSSEFAIVGHSVTKKAGLDDIYRISEEPNPFGTYTGSHKALKGLWLDENTFQATEQDMEDGFINVFTIDFEGSTFRINIKYNLGAEVNFEGTVG